MSVWSDSRIIEIAKEFTPCADEVWRLQRGLDHDCRFFQSMVHGGGLHESRGSLQGTWIFAPSGVRLARVNTRDADKVFETLKTGLAAWRELADEERWLAPGVELEPEQRWEDNWPEDGLALRRLARDLPDVDTETTRKRFNWDTVWFARDEVAGWMPAGAAVGDAIELSALIDRLARFHLVDNVRGQSVPYAPEEIEEARLTATVVAVDSGVVELELEGRTEAVADGPWLLGDNLWAPKQRLPHGIETEVVGRALWNADEGRFTELELVAIGRRYGRTTFNGRRDDTAGRIGFHLELSPDRPRIAPTFVAIYDADWIEPPARTDEIERVPERMR